MKGAYIFLFLALIILQMLSPVSSAVAISRPDPSRKPGGCYADNVGHLKKEETITIPGQCVRASCGGDGSIHYASCGLVGVSNDCHLSEVDLSKKYPDCCPKPICKH